MPGRKALGDLFLRFSPHFSLSIQPDNARSLDQKNVRQGQGMNEFMDNLLLERQAASASVPRKHTLSERLARLSRRVSLPASSAFGPRLGSMTGTGQGRGPGTS